MKKFYYLLLVCGIALMSCNPVTPDEPVGPQEDTTAVKTEVDKVDSMYQAADYTVPSFTQLCIAKETARANMTEANIAAMYEAVDALVPKEEPYCMVATFNGDPKTNMGFCWFTNDGITDGMVQIVAVENASEDDFANAVSYPATPTQTRSLRYSGKARYIVNASGIAASVRYMYSICTVNCRQLRHRLHAKQFAQNK